MRHLTLLEARQDISTQSIPRPAPLLVPDSTRLAASIEAMAAIGLQSDGSVCRRGFSDEDQLGRDRLAAWMKDAGMRVRIDAAGNLIGRLDGRDPSRPALVTGSHLDTVPTGGRFDGVLGVLAGLEVVRTLQSAGRCLNHPLEVIAFADEESTMVGCKGMAGSACSDPDSYATSNGQPIAENLERIGGHWPSLASACRSDGAIAAFVELHVEQGAVLEQRGDTIGVVEGVVGQRRFNVRIGGQANHAGTTPMSMRRDALTTAAQLVLEVERLARDHTGDPVATVGRLNVWPNAANVVPGQVELSIDLRDLCPSVLDELVANLRCLVRQIADASGCDIALEPAFSVAPTPADSRVMEAVTRACDRLGVTSSTLPSRASHDAQEMGRRWPMGMIFVPSRGGLSHSASEFTSSQQCCEGAAVLLQTLLDLDQRM